MARTETQPPTSNMADRNNPDYRSGKRRRILLVAPDPSICDSVNAMLNAMGWTCTTVHGQENVISAIEREPFDAVLLSVGHFDTQGEQAILGIQEIRPSLSDRIVAISCGRVDPESLDLIERHRLTHITQERLLVRLLNTLDELFVSSGPRKAPRKVHTARLLFDSSDPLLPADAAGSRTSGRHLTYGHTNATIDLFVHRSPGFGRVAMVGSVLKSARSAAETNAALVVAVIGRNRTLARTTTDQWGQFHLEVDLSQNPTIEIRLRERSWVAIPLESAHFLTEHTQSQATGT